MKTSLWLYGGAAVVGILLAVWLFEASGAEVKVVETEGGNTPVAATSKTSTKKSPVVTAQATPSFTNIFPQTGSYECNYEEVTSSTRTINTIYFANGKMRAEFRTVGGSSNIMVYDGAHMYVWKEGQASGTVTTPHSISDFPSIIPKNFQTGTVLGSGLNSASWSCHAWSTKASLLSKPSYVTFQ